MTNERKTYQFSEAHYRLAMESAGVGMWEWDLLSNQQVWTKECKAMGGLPLDDAEVSYEQLLSMIYPADRANFERVAWSNLRDRTELGVEFRVVWPDGSLHWIYARGRGVYDNDGKPVHMIGIAFDVTERKQAEEAQRQADQRVREILNSIGDAFVHLDKEWRFTYVNARAERIWRAYSNEELRGKVFWEIYPEIIGTDSERYARQAMETRQPATFEAYFPDRWYEVRDYPAEDGGITVFLTDITERKEAEEARRRAEQQLRDILDSVGDAYAHLDSEWRFTYVNPRAANIGKNLSVEEVIGQKIWELYPQLLGTDTERYYHQVMETRQPVAYEIYYPDIRRWFDIRAYPAEGGGITNFLTDITERKFLEQERGLLLEREHEARIEAEAAQKRSDELVVRLEQKSAFLHAVVKQAPSGLIIAEAPRGNILIYNEEAERLMGHELLASRDYTEYGQYGAIHPDGTPYRAEEYPLAKALLTGETVDQEYMLYQRWDGSRVHLSLSAAPIRDAQGHMLASIAAFNDISERYELERKKDEFICMASHELRTPLTSLKGNLQLSERRLRRLLAGEESYLSPTERTLIEHLAVWNERALRQVNTESRLIKDLLDATRIQTGKLQVSLAPEDLLQIARDVVNDLQTMVSTRAIYLELPDEDRIPVLIDRVRISQVITNYLTNALKYSADPLPVTVGVTLMENEVRVWVKDAGPGLSPEAQLYIWDRFRQVSSFATYPGMDEGGLGLGLYISQALIQQHGGRTGVESVLGVGSTFWFTLPLAKES